MSKVTVRIPTPLRKFADGQSAVEVSGTTVGEVLSALDVACPGIGAKICDEQGEPRRFVNIFYRDEDIRFLEGTKTKLDDGAELAIIPAIAGG